MAFVVSLIGASNFLRIAYSSSPIVGRAPSADRGVYVRPFAATNERYQVPKESFDYHPVWTPKGTELMYVPELGQFSIVTVQTKPTVKFGRAVNVAVQTEGPSTTVRDFDVLPDGRVLLTAPAEERGPASDANQQLRVVLNWSEELKQRVPTR